MQEYVGDAAGRGRQIAVPAIFVAISELCMAGLLSPATCITHYGDDFVPVSFGSV